jgi:hypothetical protein
VRKASWQIIKMDDKKEWDSLDVVSRWPIATRSAVTLVTVYSCFIAGLLAQGFFTRPQQTRWFLVSGILAAHVRATRQG